MFGRSLIGDEVPLNSAALKEKDNMNCDSLDSHRAHKPVVAKPQRICSDRGAIDLYFWPARVTTPKTILVVANSYGVLRYCHQLGTELSRLGFNTFAYDSRGQGSMPGRLNLKNSMYDFQLAYSSTRQFAEERGAGISIICHCAGIFPILASRNANFALDELDHLVLYSYLHDPTRLRSRVVRKMSQLKLRFDDDFFDFERDFTECYSTLESNCTVVHPLIASGLARASVEEVEVIGSTIPHCRIVTPSFGYEIVNRYQCASVAKFTEDVYSPCLDNDRFGVGHMN
jgi:hypothetical protein